jgi:galactose mutarotase-like enzyme
MTSQIRLRSADSVAEISVVGAEILRWEVAGHSLLWQPDAAVWSETAPILFPVVGWTRNGQVRVRGKIYPLGLHGFARRKRFSVAQLTENRVRLVLTSDEETRALYPFDFRFYADYALHGGALSIELGVVNRGADLMPFACGLHPGFRWPLSGAHQNGHRIIFGSEESPFVPEITPHGLFGGRLKPVPLDGKRLDLTPALFAREALCFLQARSQSLRYEAGDGTALQMDMKDFSHIALWSKPGAAFLAIEVWTGHGDPDGFEGDLFTKPSMRILPPGTSRSHKVHFRFTPSG